MRPLTQKQLWVTRWLERCGLYGPATPALVKAQAWTKEPDIAVSEVRRILLALERKGIAEIVPQADGVERWRAVE